MAATESKPTILETSQTLKTSGWQIKKKDIDTMNPALIERLNRVLNFYGHLQAENIAKERSISVSMEVYEKYPSDDPATSLGRTRMIVYPLPTSAESFLTSVDKDQTKQQIKTQLIALKSNLELLSLYSDLSLQQKADLMCAINTIEVEITNPDRKKFIAAFTAALVLVSSTWPWRIFHGVIGALAYYYDDLTVTVPYEVSIEPQYFCAWIENIHSAIAKICAELQQAETAPIKKLSP